MLTEIIENGQIYLDLFINNYSNKMLLRTLIVRIWNNTFRELEGKMITTIARSFFIGLRSAYKTIYSTPLASLEDPQITNKCR